MNTQEANDFWQIYNQFYNTRVKAVYPKIKAIVSSQYNYVIAGGQANLYERINNLPTLELFELLKKLYIDAARIWGNKTKQQIKLVQIKKALGQMGYNESLQKEIEAYFRLYLLEDVTQINDTTKNDLLEIFDEGFRLGKSFNEISSNIEVLGLSAVRARRIARTEVVTSANRGAMISAKATGLNLQKQWIAARDKRTRDDHRNVDNTIIAYDELFTVGSDKMECPGDRGGKDGRPKTSAKEVINCRCCVAFVPID